MTEAELEWRAINEAVQIVPYDDQWPGQFCAERIRLLAVAPVILSVEHVGSTAVPGLAAKPIVDMMATVPNMGVADRLVERLCSSGYITSAEFNRSLADRRWLMRHAGGRRTHHLHLVSVDSHYWKECIRFRDVLRRDSALAARYVALKQRLASQFGSDRDGYGSAKAEFIASALLADG